MSLPFLLFYHLLGFLGSDRLQGSLTWSQIQVDVLLLPHICFAKG